MKANRLEEEKHNWILHLAGPKVQSIYFTLPDPPQEERPRGPLAHEFIPFQRNEFDVIVEKLQNFFAPKRNALFERHIFRGMKQKEGERIDVFSMRLRTQAERCEFGDQIDENIKDQITSGCSSNWLREKILENGKETLEEIIKRARIHEIVSAQKKSFVLNENKQLSGQSNYDVCKIDFRRGQSGPRFNFKNNGRNPLGRDMRCSRCGLIGHKSSDENCPAKGKTCRQCNGKNHFARQCFGRNKIKRETSSNDSKSDHSKLPIKRQREGDSIRLIDDESTRKEDDYDDVFCIATEKESNSIWCKVGGIEVKVIVDSGSQYNLVDRDTWAELKAKNIETITRNRRTEKNFRAYGGKELKLLGVFEAKVEIGLKNTVAQFYVVNEQGKMLLGGDTSMKLRVLKIGYDVNQISQPTTVLGKIKGVMVEIPVKHEEKGVIQRYRRVPAPLEMLVDEKIDGLLRQGIIERVNGPSKWVSPLVTAPKQDGDIRICVDMKRANQAVERENHPLPTMEHFLPHLGSAKCFSKLDVKQAYHQV